MVRAIFLLNQDLATRGHFVTQTLHNEKWTLPNTRTQIPDRNMIDLVDTLHGWTNSVYKLGCAFIQLSPMVDYRNENPFHQLSLTEIDNIKNHLHFYHGFPMINDLNMNNVSTYLLSVLDKVSSNLECYIGYLEVDKVGVV